MGAGATASSCNAPRDGGGGPALRLEPAGADARLAVLVDILTARPDVSGALPWEKSAARAGRPHPRRLFCVKAARNFPPDALDRLQKALLSQGRPRFRAGRRPVRFEPFHDPSCTLDSRRRLLQARRRDAGDRASRRRLDPSRRDGRAFRAQYQLRPGGGEGAAALDRQGLRRPPDDRPGRPLPRRLRRGRGRCDHRPCRGRSAYPPLAPDDPGPRQARGRGAEPRHAGLDDRTGARHGRSRAGDDGQSRLRRPEFYRFGAGNDRARQSDDGWPRHRHLRRWRHHPETAGPAAQAGANILVAGSAAFKGGPDHYEKNVAAIRAAADAAGGRDGVRC